MKTKLTFAAFAFVVVCLCVAPASAQVAHPQHIAKIPFAFTVGGTQMPAGEYAITQYGNRLQVRPLEGGKGKFVTALPTESLHAVETSHLAFKQRGEGLVLSNLYFEGTQSGVEILKK